MGFKVNKKMCNTCIFGNNSPIDQERFEELKTIWDSQNRHQQCHKTGIACRGHFNAGRKGEMKHVIGTFVDTVLPSNGMTCEEKYERAIGLGWVEEIDNAD